jgi:hypothetical protein
MKIKPTLNEIPVNNQFIRFIQNRLALLSTLILVLACVIDGYSANPIAWRNDPNKSSLTLLPGNTQSFKIEASDSDGNLAGCEWYLNGSYVAVHSMSGSFDTDIWSNTFANTGTYIVECIAYDSNWAYSNSSTWTVYVQNNSSPTISRVNPSISFMNVMVGNSETFRINATDIDENLSYCEWYLNGEFKGSNTLTGNNDEGSWEYTFISGGTYNIEAIAYDAENKFSNVIAWSIKVGTTISHTKHEFFDDFSYADCNDNVLESFGWNIVDGISGPPGNAKYNKENVSFEPDANNSNNKIMLLTTKTSNSFESMELARIESEIIFLEGTYAARVYFDNSPIEFNDGNIETFYTINHLNYPNELNYSECDFEYLPYDVWGGGDTSEKMYLTTWETVQEEPWDPNNASTPLSSDFSGWHTLLFQATNGQTVKYFIDGEFQKEHHLSNKGDLVYPETQMQIAFANWIWTGYNNTGLGKSPVTRTCTMKADWVFHAKDTELTTAEVEYLVKDFRSKSIERINTMNSALEIHASANSKIRGNINGTGNFCPGDTVNLTANANNGYYFINWTEDDREVSTNPDYSFIATSNRTLVANFNSTTNSSDNSEIKAFNIYPNPTHADIIVEGKNIQTIEVYNTQSVLVKNLKVSSGVTVVPLGNFVKGIYILKLSTEDKFYTTKILLN